MGKPSKWLGIHGQQNVFTLLLVAPAFIAAVAVATQLFDEVVHRQRSLESDTAA